MREPPGDPSTRNSRPAESTTIAGVIPDSIRFPGAMAFASPWTRPNRFGRPGAVLKSSISSFSRNPAPVTVTALPKSLLSVVVHDTAFPSASTIEKCVVSDRKSTRLNSSHSQISYAVFCLKKKNMIQNDRPEPALQVLAPPVSSYFWAVALDPFGPSPVLRKFWFFPLPTFTAFLYNMLLQL